MIKYPIVGQVVELNDDGMEIIGGLTSAEMVKQAKRMILIYVDAISLTGEEDKTFSIRVDQPLIDRFLIDNHHVNLLDEPPEKWIACAKCFGRSTFTKQFAENALVIVECPACNGVGNIKL